MTIEEVNNSALAMEGWAVDALKAQLARVQQQLSNLTASQRMLAASLVAVMVLSLLFWGRYAGTSEMEPVLDQSMKADDVGKITAEIRRMNVEYKVVGDRVLVPSDRKLEVLAALSYASAIPESTNNAYEEIVSKINPFDSQSNSDARRVEAKGAYLTQVIRRWPNVASADVIIDASGARRIGDTSNHSTASVQIMTRDGGKPDKNLVRSAAATVAGAQSGLKRSNVTVVINGVTCPVRDDDAAGNFGGGADEMLSARQMAEHFFTSKISGQLSFIPNVIVTVSVDVESESRSSIATKFDPKGIAKTESRIESDSTDQSAPGPAAPVEPGAVPNAPLSVGPQSSAASNSAGTTSTKNHESTAFENRFSTERIDTVTPAGRSRVTGTAVRIPRSYLVMIFKSREKSLASAREPDEEMLKPILAEQMQQIRDDVKRCTDLKTDDTIAVAPYIDLMPTMLAAATTTPVSSSAIAAMFGGHFKEIGVGVLALFSLFMVSSMVKKSNVPSPVLAPIDFGDVPQLGGDDNIAGDVGEGNSMLDGVEMDAESVKAQQMVDQVSTLVKENPDAAATLVKRWLNRT